jgi:endonuclease G
MPGDVARRNKQFADIRARPTEAAIDLEPRERQLRFLRRRGRAAPAGMDDQTLRSELEKTIGNPDFLDSSWLKIGAKRADAVARIEIDGEYGTGFLVSPWLLMTNNHMLPSPTVAADAELTFRYEKDGRDRISRSRVVRLTPERCFVTSPEKQLDYTLVAVEDLEGKTPGEVFGSIALDGGTGKALVGNPVNIIQHPGGDPRQVAFRNNLLMQLPDDRFLIYETDTQGGSSGSPVFNDRWELVALHKGAESARDSSGREIDINGLPVADDTPDRDRVWVANRGIRVSALIADLRKRKPTGSDGVALIDELLRLGGNA